MTLHLLTADATTQTTVSQLYQNAALNHFYMRTYYTGTGELLSGRGQGDRALPVWAAQKPPAQVLPTWIGDGDAQEKVRDSSDVTLTGPHTNARSTYRCAIPALRTAQEMALTAVHRELSRLVSSPVPLALRPSSMTKRVTVTTLVSKAPLSDMAAADLLPGTNPAT